MRLPLHARAGRLLVALGLAISTLLPGAAIASAADPLVLKVGTDQDLQVLNPLQLGHRRRLRGLHAQLRPARELRAGPVAGAGLRRVVDPATARRGRSRSGRDEVVRRPAGDVRGRALDVPDRSSTAPHRSARYARPGLPRAVPARRGRHDRGQRPGSRDARRQDRPRRTPCSSRPTSRSCRSTSGRSTRSTRSATPRRPASSRTSRPVVGTGPYQAVEWVAGDHIRFARNPNYWGTQKGAEDEIILQHFASGDTMVQALKTGEIDYVRGVLRRPVQRPQERAEHRDRRGLRQRLLRAVVQHRRQQEGLRRLDLGADRPGVP